MGGMPTAAAPGLAAAWSAGMRFCSPGSDAKAARGLAAGGGGGGGVLCFCSEPLTDAKPGSLEISNAGTSGIGSAGFSVAVSPTNTVSYASHTFSLVGSPLNACLGTTRYAPDMMLSIFLVRSATTISLGSLNSESGRSSGFCDASDGSTGLSGMSSSGPYTVARDVLFRWAMSSASEDSIAP